MRQELKERGDESERGDFDDTHIVKFDVAIDILGFCKLLRRIREKRRRKEKRDLRVCTGIEWGEMRGGGDAWMRLWG